MSNDELLRWGIIGCGAIGPKHARFLERMPKVSVVAAADNDPEALERMCTRFGLKGYLDFQAMILHEHLDVVSVCTPSGLHHDMAIWALQHGCHVLVEKPMAINVPACDAMITAQRETGKILSVVHQHRYDAASIQAKELMKSNALGTVSLGDAQVKWYRSTHYYQRNGGWRGTWAMDGGGVLMNQAIHAIDLLTWLMGPVASVRAYSDHRFHAIEAEDSAVAAIKFQSGALGVVEGTTVAYPGVTTRLEIVGSRGSLRIEDDALDYLYTAQPSDNMGDYGKRQPSLPALSLPLVGFAAQLQDLVDSIVQQRPPEVTAEEARQPVKVIRAIYLAAQTGKEVTLECDARR